MSELITGIKNGMPEDFDLLRDQWREFEGKKVIIWTRRKVDKRSNPQNRYWQGVVLPLIRDYMKANWKRFTDADCSQLTKEDWHNWYKSKGYFGYKEMFGEKIPKGSSESTTLEFQEAKDRVQREWAVRGLDIPDPNEEDYRKGNYHFKQP